MKFLARIAKSLKSLLAAIFAAACCFVPAWYTHVGIQLGYVPDWAYACIAGLALVGAAVVLAFLSKAVSGQGPLQD